MLVLKNKTPSLQMPSSDDSHSDILILMGPHIIPVHSSILGKSSSFFQNTGSPTISCQHRVKIVTQALKIETVISVFKYHYGHQLQIPRNEELMDFMEVATFFGFQSLRDKLINDLITNFEKYDFFFVLQFAREFRLQKVEELCWNKMEEQNYEQINYNKYDFLCCAQELYLEVLEKKARHEQTQGNAPQDITPLIQEFNSFGEDKMEVPKALKIVFKGGNKINQIEIQSIEESLVELEDEANSDKSFETKQSPNALNSSNQFSESEENEQRKIIVRRSGSEQRGEKEMQFDDEMEEGSAK